MCVAAICTSACVWRWRDSKYDDASSTPTTWPCASRTGAALHDTSPRLKK